MLGTLIARLGLPFLVSLIGGALSRIDNPTAQSASEALNSVENALTNGAITAEQMAEANRHAEKLAELKSKEYETAMSEINQSLRVDATSNDPYVRRMRPTFGYFMAVTWAAQMMGLAYVMIFETDKAGAVMQGMESLSTIWAVGLSVLGIIVYKRSEDKKIFALGGTAAAKPADPVTKTTNLSVSRTTVPNVNE